MSRFGKKTTKPVEGLYICRYKYKIKNQKISLIHIES